MADFLERLTLLITADSAQAINVLKGFGNTAHQELSKVETAAGVTGKNAGGAFGKGLQDEALLAVSGLQAAVGSVGLALFAKSSLQDAVQLERANAAVKAGLDATSGAAHATEGSIGRLADTIQKTDAIYAGNIKQAAGLLLAFREVKNEAGASNDVFNRTLAVSAGLSNFLGRDLNSVVIQLGRALENPQAGMQALSRSGVTLSASLRQTILHFAKQGDLLSAQKALLAELEKRYVESGAAIAKADPFQQFSVSVKAFKTSVGEDLLPAAAKILDFGSKALGVFGALPGPVRETTEALIATGIAIVPLLKVKQVLDSLRAASAASSAASGGGASAAEAGVASSMSAQAAAATEASTATAGLNEQLSLLGPEADAAATGQAGLVASLEAETVVAEEATVANDALALSLGGVVAAVVVGIGAFVATSSVLNQAFGGTHHSFQEVTKDIYGIGTSIKDVAEDSSWEKLLHLGDIKQDITNIDDANAGFIQKLDSQGIEAAAHAYGKWVVKLVDAGFSLSEIADKMGPFLAALAQARHEADATATSIGALEDQFHQFAQSLDSLKAANSVADSFDSIQSAVDKLNADKADAAGTGEKAVAAAQAEKDANRGLSDAYVAVGDARQRLTDSYTRLQDAQDRVRDSTDKLKDAQEALDTYNSARGAQERALRLDILQRRIVTTPAESDQKQLDLLKFQDDNKNKQDSLQKAVVDGLRGVRDATRGVADAQRGIIDAERAVEDATQRVADAQVKVQDAIAKRKKVHDDATKNAQDDERKVQEAILNTITTMDDAAQKGLLNNEQIKLWGTYLDTLTGKYAPGSDLDKAVDAFYKKLLLYQAAAANPPKPQDDKKTYPPGTGYPNPNGGPPIGSINGVDPYRGIPGGVGGLGHFADGGMVPGLRGTPQLAIVHGGERVLTPEQQRNGGGVIVNQTNNFGGDAPSKVDLEYANRALGWRLARLGRG